MQTETNTAAFNAGYEAKAAEIRETGFEAARDKFNADVPPGRPWTGSLAGYHYAKGEAAALAAAI